MLIPILGGDPYDICRRVREEIDPDLFVAWNPQVYRYEVHDRRAKGGTLVMRVQEPDGSFRQLDSRVLETLRRCRVERAKEILREIERTEEKLRERAIARRAEALAEALADDLIFAGKVVVQGYDADRAGPGGEARAERADGRLLDKHGDQAAPEQGAR